VLDLFNPWSIAAAQIDTLRNFETKRLSPVAMILFFGVPLSTAAGLLFAEITITESAANIMITSMSIFAGLLFNLLLLVYDVVSRGPRPLPPMSDEERWHAAMRQQFLSEIFSNISFAIYASVVVVLLLLGEVVLSGTGNRWFSGAVFFCTMMFLMTLLMVLQRVHLLFGQLPREMAGAGASPGPSGSAAGPPAAGSGRHLKVVPAPETGDSDEPI
jgi:hypothetical protein